MVVGRFYQNRGLYAAAIGRFRRVVEQYQTTNHVPEALHRLTEIYLRPRAGGGGAAHRFGAGPQLPGQRVVSRLLRAADVGRSAGGTAGAVRPLMGSLGAIF